MQAEPVPCPDCRNTLIRVRGDNVVCPSCGHSTTVTVIADFLRSDYQLVWSHEGSIAVLSTLPRPVDVEPGLSAATASPASRPLADELPEDRSVLGVLLAKVEVARRQQRVHLRRRGDNVAKQLAAQRIVLDALERYVVALEARNLPIPRQIRDDLRLRRSLCGPVLPPPIPRTLG